MGWYTSMYTDEPPAIECRGFVFIYIYKLGCTYISMKKLIALIVLCIASLTFLHLDKDVATKRFVVDNPSFLSVDTSAEEYTVTVNFGGIDQQVKCSKEVYQAARNGEKLEIVVEIRPLTHHTEIVSVGRIHPDDDL